MEFKLDGSAKEALEQIRQRGYLDKYRSSNKRLIAVGLNLSSSKREVDDLQVEFVE